LSCLPALEGNVKSQVFEKRMLKKIFEPNKEGVPLYDELRILNKEDSLVLFSCHCLFRVMK
jgi:hypothetical protein